MRTRGAKEIQTRPVSVYPVRGTPGHPRQHEGATRGLHEGPLSRATRARAPPPYRTRPALLPHPLILIHAPIPHPTSTPTPPTHTHTCPHTAPDQHSPARRVWPPRTSAAYHGRGPLPARATAVPGHVCRVCRACGGYMRHVCHTYTGPPLPPYPARHTPPGYRRASATACAQPLVRACARARAYRHARGARGDTGRPSGRRGRDGATRASRP